MGTVAARLTVGDRLVMDVDGLHALLDALGARGYTPIGPVVRDGAIVHAELASADDLPVGWTEEQDAGTYRLRRREDDARFGFASGPQSFKPFLFPPSSSLFRASAEAGPAAPEEAPRAYAFIGVRACDLAAIGVQDRVFMGDRYTDPGYAARREAAFIVAVNCGQAGGTCFCASMGTGPRATDGFDLALTELMEDGPHEFLVEVGTDRGAEAMQDVPSRPAGAENLRRADRVVERTAASMGRTMPAEGLRDLLYRNLEHPRWEQVAARCLSCANCTLACPTCFCWTVEDSSDLSGAEAERNRVWDSCFSLDHSYIHGGSVRRATASRYRQWMTHKLATWIDQFGTSGCVGCGRCITWCPVGIDITKEVAAIAATDGASRKEGPHGDA